MIPLQLDMQCVGTTEEITIKIPLGFMGTVRLSGYVPGEIKPIALSNEPVPGGICAAVSAGMVGPDEDCVHGECDDCQRARGEDPVNYGDPNAHPEDPRESDYCPRQRSHAGMVALHEFDREVCRLNGLPDPEPGFSLERCECGSGNHARGPGHAHYCGLLEP